NSGIHIIRYHADVTPGQVPLEQVSDQIRAELLATKQDETYAAQVETWESEADIKKYPGNLSVD
ncbi:MAG: hypothetical protein GX558_05365, partial [Clostridiales bacterium]|nr:hypothetical protein [Clostridiales bacterium]